MSILSIFIARYRQRKAIKERRVALSLCLKEIRKSHNNIKAELVKLKNKFSRNGMVEVISITACEVAKMDRALKALEKEGF